MRIYPPGQITRYGSLRLMARTEPLVIITSHDRQIQWYISGGMEPMMGVQEGAVLTDGIEGLFPGFQNIGHKGARQHGVTYQRTVYDPGEIELVVDFTVAPTPSDPRIAAAAMRRVIRDWMATWSPERPPRLDIVTPDMGRWWCIARLNRKPSDKQFRAQMHRLRQSYVWSIVNDFAFWRGVDSVSDFRIKVVDATDGFNRADADGLGPQWHQTYLGPGDGTFGTDAPASLNEIQVIDIDGLPSGGTFKLFFMGDETINLNYNASGPTVQSALEALPSIGSGNVSVVKTLANRYEVTFQNALGKRNVPELGATHAFTGGIFPSIRVDTVLDGFVGITGLGRARWFEDGNDSAEVRNWFIGMNAVQLISLVGAPTGGNFILIFNGQSTAALAYNSTAAQIKSALEALSNIAANEVEVTGDAGGPWTVTFVNGLGLSQQPLITWTFVNEVQHLSIDGSPSSGTWQATFDGAQTATIVRNPTANAIQLALEALPNIGVGDVLVTGSGTQFDVEFKGALASRNVPTMTTVDTFNNGNVTVSITTQGVGLTGGEAPSVSTAEVVEGTDGTTGSDLQVITLQTAELYGLNLIGNGFLDIWARWNGNESSPTALRFRMGGGIGVFGDRMILSRFNAGVETVMATKPLIIPPLWYETWTFVVGTLENARHYKIYRNKFLVWSIKEVGTGSALGGSNRGSGFGAWISNGLFTQGPPAAVNSFSVGDNAEMEFEGHLPLTNFGTEEAYPRYLCYGPGLFRIGDGPDAEVMVEFGPLLPGQIALISTLPRLYGVVDVSPDQPPQELNAFQEFIDRLISFATNNNVPPLLEQFKSAFGINPPQGDLYHLLEGRFTVPIPPKPVGAPPTTVRIPVQIVDGDVDSKIVGAITPLRTWAE